MHQPCDGDEKCRDSPFIPSFPQCRQQAAQQQKQQPGRDGMDQDIGAMITDCGLTPQPIIQHIGKILNGPVVGRERFREEMLPEDLGGKRRAAKERVLTDQIGVIPYPFALETWEVGAESDGEKQEQHQPRAQPSGRRRRAQLADGRWTWAGIGFRQEDDCR